MVNSIHVELVLALPERQRILTFKLPTPCTVAQMLERPEVASQINAPFDMNQVGIYSKQVKPDHILSDGDRVELYRDLTLAPMERRRLLASKSAKRKQSKKS